MKDIRKDGPSQVVRTEVTVHKTGSVNKEDDISVTRVRGFANTYPAILFNIFLLPLNKNIYYNYY